MARHSRYSRRTCTWGTKRRRLVLTQTCLAREHARLIASSQSSNLLTVPHQADRPEKLHLFRERQLEQSTSNALDVTENKAVFSWFMALVASALLIPLTITPQCFSVQMSHPHVKTKNNSKTKNAFGLGSVSGMLMFSHYICHNTSK